MERQTSFFSQPEQYLLMNKDVLWAKFSWNEFDEISLIQEYRKLPFGISFDSFIRRRTPPKHREHMKQLLTSLGLSSDRDVIDFGKGLSLTDTFWIQKATEDLNWDQINLYDNRFDETIAHIAFDGGLMGQYFSQTSPEYATDGMLAKCWVKQDSGIYLKKAGTELGVSNDGREPYSEVLASQILDALEYPHVSYSLEKYRGRLVSSCPLITSKDVSMFPIYMFLKDQNTKISIPMLDMLYSEYGFQDSLYQMLIFDYLVLNPDRHASNFGLLLNSESLQPIGAIPIFDNGAGVLNYYSTGSDLASFIQTTIPYLYPSFELGARYAKDRIRKHNVQKLISFRFDRSRVNGYSADKIDCIEKFIQIRVRQFLLW